MVAGVAVHIVQRGNNRQACFYGDQDRSSYLFHLDRLLGRTGCDLHAYCLMTNHVHLLVTPRLANSCARLMKHLGQLHTQYVNRHYGRSGTLWEGRFRSCLVESEHYLLACYRYIESNPVRAGICAHPRDYPWSSYRANAEGEDDALVTEHEEYLRLGLTDAARWRAYADLWGPGLESGQVEEIRMATNGNFALGSKLFKRKLASVMGRRVERGKPGRPSQPAQLHESQMELLSEPKKTWSVPD